MIGYSLYSAAERMILTRIKSKFHDISFLVASSVPRSKCYQ